jgi:hypothetical protein
MSKLTYTIYVTSEGNKDTLYGFRYTKRDADALVKHLLSDATTTGVTVDITKAGI